MPTLDLAAKLAVLDEARRRLEAELERDEAWRALNTPVPASEADAPDREARDHRLRQALQNNPVFVAWSNVQDAAEALRDRAEADEGDPGSLQAPQTHAASAAPQETPAEDAPPLLAAPLHEEPSTAAVNSPYPVEDEASVSDDLPPEIAALIRAEAVAEDGSDSDQEQRAVGERATRAVDKLLAIPSVAPVAPEQLETARRADRLARELHGIRERRRVQARAASLEAEIITQARSVAQHPRPEQGPPVDGPDVDFLLNPAGAPWMPFDTPNDPQEEIVTAARVIEPAKPVAPVRPSREAFLGRLRAEEGVPPPLERTRRISVTEEAEVTLVRPGEDTQPTIAQAPPPADPEPAPPAAAKPARPLRRLINVLKGK